MNPTQAHDLIAEARSWRYVREIPEEQNRGLRVEAVQHWAGGTYGDSWCMEMLWVWLDRYTQGKPPVPRVQSCQHFREIATANGWRVTEPVPGDIVVSIDPAANHAHHIALVTATETGLVAIAGNTSEDGISSNGDRVAEHEISAENKEFFRIPM